MPTNAAHVTVAIDGMIRVAPTTTPAPTGTAGALTGWDDLGFLSEDSFTIKLDSKAEDIKAWQNGAVVRKIISESGAMIEFEMIEHTAKTLEVYFGTAPITAGSEVSVPIKPGITGGQRSLIVDVVDGKNLERYYFHHVELTERKEIKGGAKNPLGLGVTMTAYPDSQGVVGTLWSTVAKEA